MPDNLQTYAFEFKGGLISNLAPIQQGVQQPGTARILRNFEPSIEGGYKKVKGYTKFDSAIVPGFNTPKVHGASQSGTTLIIGNVHFTPVAGDTLTITGVSGTYTVASGGVSHSTTTKRTTLTLTTSLDSSPADQANVTFTTDSTKTINGLAAWQSSVIAVRNNSVFRSTGSGFTQINVSQYGTPLVNGGSQSGGTLNIDGLTSAPQAGDTFTIAGVTLIYTVSSQPTVNSAGEAAVSISPNLASSPSDDAAITFLVASRTNTAVNRFAKYRIGTTEKIAGVDGANYPFVYDATTYTPLTGAPDDVEGASHIASYKNQLFFAKGDVLTFTAPYTDNDFDTGNGAGNISVGSDITGLIAFRDQLIIFSENKIDKLVGNTIADFILQPVTRNIGCIDSDTIREVAGDVVFLGPDGIRSLSGSDKVGDFDLAVISKPIQKEVTDVISGNSSFSSVTIKSKSQYRLLGFNSNISEDAATGILGTQLAGPQGTMFGWSEIRGFKAFVADSDFKSKTETVVFANTNGYVYNMDSGNSFDSSNIKATFATPFIPLNDAELRKTIYKLHLYTEPTGSFETNASLKFDLNEQGSVQPEAIALSNTAAGLSGVYGKITSTYGTAVFGGRLKKKFTAQTIGSGFNTSVQFFSDDSNPSFSLDAATLEYGTFDRR
tara:strand:+ start:1629 stop:3617 length:1989 start_codon:yes stop_codon:yes gene_type:complete